MLKVLRDADDHTTSVQTERGRIEAKGSISKKLFRTFFRSKEREDRILGLAEKDFFNWNKKQDSIGTRFMLLIILL